VVLTTLALVAALLAVAVPPLAQHATQLLADVPGFLRQVQNHSSTVGRLNARFQLQQHLTTAVNGSTVLTHLVGAVTLVVNAVTKPGHRRGTDRLLPRRPATDPRHLLPVGPRLPPTPGDPDRR